MCLWLLGYSIYQYNHIAGGEDTHGYAAVKGGSAALALALAVAQAL